MEEQECGRAGEGRRRRWRDGEIDLGEPGPRKSRKSGNVSKTNFEKRAIVAVLGNRIRLGIRK